MAKNTINFMKATREELQTFMDSLEATNDKIETAFEKERGEWSAELNPLYDTLRYMDKTKVVNLQAETLSLRQRIQDKITYYMSQLSKRMPIYRQSVGDRFEFYATGFGIKSSDGLKKSFVDRDMSQRKRNIELLENHIEFLRECRYSCDQIQYSVKNIVGIAQYIT